MSVFVLVSVLKHITANTSFDVVSAGAGRFQYQKTPEHLTKWVRNMS
jgi:hypothetical protein